MCHYSGVEVRPTYTVEDVLALANTVHGAAAHHGVRSAPPNSPDHDHLVDPLDAADFLRSHDVAVPMRSPDAEVLARLRAIREAIQLAVVGRSGHARTGIGRLLKEAMFELTVDYQLVPHQSGWRAVADGLISVAIELIDRAEQLKHCNNPQCRFLFMDRSARQNRRWCDMAVCGNRAKAGRFRRRHRAQPASGGTRRDGAKSAASAAL